MKKKTIFMTLFIIPILILFVILLASTIAKFTGTIPSTIVKPIQNSQWVPSPTISPIPEQSWKTFRYDFAGFEPKFSIDYPADWEAMIDYESSGGHDVRLNHNERLVHFDATVTGYQPHEELMKGFITLFGSYEFEFSTTSIEIGHLNTSSFPQNAPYSIFQLKHNTNGSTNYVIIAQTYTLDGDEGYLFIWDRSGQDLKLIKEMLASLRVIS